MKRKIKIDNRTHWRSGDLRRFVVKVAAQLPERSLPFFAVRFGYNRQVANGWVSGHAPLGGYRATVNVPSQVIDPVDLALTISHELAHLRGLRHGPEMRGNPRWYRLPGSAAVYSWAAALPLRRKTVRAKPVITPELQLARIELAQKRWTTRAKRAQTALRKLRVRQRYYEGRAAAARAPDKTS